MIVTVVCPRCDVNIEYESTAVDSTIVCPKCSQAITVSRGSGGSTVQRPTRLREILFWIVAALACLFLGLYVHKLIQARELRRPVIVETNVVVTNVTELVTTNITITTNVVTTNVVQTNAVVTPPRHVAAPPSTNVPTGPKVILRGYNLAFINGAKYAHAVVQNLTSSTLRQVHISFDAYGFTRRRGRYLIGHVTDTYNNLAPYQYGELRKAVGAQTIELVFVSLSAD